MAERQRYSGQVALVTGGGHGIGAACCERLASEGAAVAILDRDLDSAQSVAARLESRGFKAYGMHVDVTDSVSADQAIRSAHAKWGRLDLAVNNAGIGGAFHSLHQLPIDQWHSTLAVNLTGVFFCLRVELPLMAAQGAGAIVNVASIMGVVGAAQVGAYAASKHGVVGLTKVAAIENGRNGVRVNAVAPTFVRTDLTASLDDAAWVALSRNHPLGRLPSVEEVASLVAFLGSSDAVGITGSTHLIDSGFTAS